MRSPIVVKSDPVADHAADLLQSLESVSMHALVFGRSYHAFHQVILFGCVRRDELLVKSVAARQCGVAATDEDQSRYPSEAGTSVARVPARRSARSRLARAPLPRSSICRCVTGATQQFAATAVDDEGQHHPAIPATPDTAQIRRPSFIRCGTEGIARTRGLKPTGRLRTCQCLSWKIRCTLFLLNLSRCATVR